MAYPQASPTISQYPTLQLLRGGISDDTEPVTVRFVKVPVDVVFNTTLSPWARLVYCALESHKGERGIFPRQEVLAKELGTSTDTVGRALKELRAKQLIEVDRQGRGHANRYSLSHDSAPVRNHKSDDTASVRDQNEHDSASLRELETAPMRNPETAPVRNPIRTITSELELKELSANAPAAVAAEPVKPEISKSSKPRTARQIESDRLFEQRYPLFVAYCRGISIDPDGFDGKSRQGRALHDMKPIDDAPEFTVDVMERLTRYTVACFAWRDGRKTPYVSEVIAAYAEWKREGEPIAPPPKRSNGAAPASNGVITKRDNLTVNDVMGSWARKDGGS